MKTFTKAYFTVEAALVMPIVLGVHVFILYALSFLYNRTLFEQDIFALTLRGGISQEDHIQNRIDEIELETEKIYWDKYLWLEWDDPTMDIQGDHITISANAVQIGAGKVWLIQSKQRSDHINPVLFIRGVLKLKELLLEDDTDDADMTDVTDFMDAMDDTS
ncbi:MAG: hypothetical protein LBM60_05255 [Clostridium sp.]|jgi:hypothetical protein|nr:hypothetical protein [Clostridium sp.]